MANWVDRGRHVVGGQRRDQVTKTTVRRFYNVRTKEDRMYLDQFLKEHRELVGQPPEVVRAAAGLDY